MLNRISGYRFAIACSILVCLLVLPAWAKAQEGAIARLKAVRLEDFPTITANLDIKDEQGKFVRGLQPSDLVLLEDGKSLPLTSLQEIRAGAQVVIGLNAGPALAVRNSRGVSRYDSIASALESWAKSRMGTTIDDWSLITPQGAEPAHYDDPTAWLSRLALDEQVVKAAKPQLDILSRAVDLAADPSPRPGMGRVVLFVTPPLEGQVEIPLQSLASRAEQQQVVVYVWLVTPPAAPLSPTSNQLADFATKTGGALIQITADQDIPNPEDYLEPRRSIYQFTYQSEIKESGDHQISIEARLPQGTIASQPENISIDIQPPNPAFITPDLKIHRVPPKDLPDGVTVFELSPQEYSPAEETLQVLIEFPDGRERPLQETTLYVDDNPVARNTKPPFDRFRWDLSQYEDSGEHRLKVEAVDSLGLSGSSIETFTQVFVDRPKATPFQALSQHTFILAVLVTLVAGSMLLLVLILGGRVRPYAMVFPRDWRRSRSPVVQPPPAEEKLPPHPHRLSVWVNRLHWPQRRVQPQAEAFLTRNQENEEAPSIPPVPINTGEVTFGSDPNQAMIVLEDPSVEALHARLVQVEKNVYLLADEDSIAGTWINYTPVLAEGSYLEHGDLIHIGRVAFRFTLRNPAPARKPVVILLEPEHEPG